MLEGMADPLQVDALTVDRLAARIDHAVLAPDHTLTDVEVACAEAVAYGFAAVTVPPYDIVRVARRLVGTDVAAGGAVGLPFGHSGLKAKRTEARTCVRAGADEIEMVINLTAVKSGQFGDVRDEIAAVRRIAEGLVLTVILECCRLTDDETVRACWLALEAGADLIETSTGFAGRGATAHDVALVQRTVGDGAGVKATGGIRTFERVRQMFEAGAVRIGTGAGVAIVRDFEQQQQSRVN